MSLFKLFFTGVVASCLIMGLAACKDANPTSSQTAAPKFSTDAASLNRSLNVRIEQFEDIYNSGEIATLFDFTPPEVLSKILSSGNVTRAQLDSQIDQVWKMTMQTVEIGGFDLDKTAREIEFLDNGRPYKILPTSTNMKIKANGSEIISESETLALIEDGEWYIVRLDEAAQIKIFRDAYPDFDGVDVMVPVMTMDGEEVKL